MNHPSLDVPMLRVFAKTLAAAFLAVNLGGWACYYDDDDHHDFREDVTVEITGDNGTDFDAFFEDDHDTDTFSADVPFTAEFDHRDNFFTAIVDKDSGGSEEICVRLSTDHNSHKECTTLPYGRVSVTLVF